MAYEVLQENLALKQPQTFLSMSGYAHLPSSLLFQDQRGSETQEWSGLASPCLEVGPKGDPGSGTQGPHRLTGLTGHTQIEHFSPHTEAHGAASSPSTA